MGDIIICSWVVSFSSAQHLGHRTGEEKFGLYIIGVTGVIEAKRIRDLVSFVRESLK